MPLGLVCAALRVYVGFVMCHCRVHFGPGVGAIFKVLLAEGKLVLEDAPTQGPARTDAGDAGMMCLEP